ncbi:hypothetical protein GKZ68_05480 [Hymenobacter sp. BRD128]|uniref:hypothetical protein n=1 Tax=Hymenobacter sp. BRD128 TaxID=2675878 RepID=UPI00156717B5|nr:hypothetical protein [Hymenobacter sp. BRD128]QKG56141.1 hypothetical protein GKZ68_05480 [Hymenobacter sp. BRD128]
MLDLPIPNNQVVTVQVAQTTFAVLSMPGKQFQIDFIDKAEACLKPGLRGEFSIHKEHPLLLNYNSRSTTVYISSRPQDPEGLLDRIKEQIKAGIQGWRDWHRVIFGKGAFGGDYILRKNLLDGSGMLLEDVPVTIAEAVIVACAEYGASAYCIGGIGDVSPIAPVFHLLLIGKGYVIAKDFCVKELPKEKPPLPSQ